MNKYLYVFMCSMIPIIELRGAIPLGFSQGLSWWQSYCLAVVGNLLPVPFILLGIRGVLSWMKRENILPGFVNWIEGKGRRGSSKVLKYSTFGLLIFVAVPLPGTGAWTGALIASLLNMRFKNAMLMITLGVLISGCIVTVITYCAVGGILSIIF